MRRYERRGRAYVKRLTNVLGNKWQFTVVLERIFEKNDTKTVSVATT
jgi:hypothetical protein